MGIVMLDPNGSEIPSQYVNKIGAALVTCVQHFQFFTDRFRKKNKQKNSV